MRFLIYFFAVVFTGSAGPLLALAAAKPQRGEIMLVIGPDAVAVQTAVLNAGGRVIGPQVARFGVLALSAEEAFATTLLEEGAWFVVDGRRIAFLCGIEV